MNQTEREYIRHPSTIPLEYCINENPPVCDMNFANNVSQGGLSFQSNRYIEPEKWLHLIIPVDEKYFEIDAKVCWCKPQLEAKNDQQTFDIGVSFCNQENAFSARMVEQVCHIEDYKKHVLQQEGRFLNSDQAAAEWIGKYADSFPSAIN